MPLGLVAPELGLELEQVDKVEEVEDKDVGDEESDEPFGDGAATCCGGNLY